MYPYYQLSSYEIKECFFSFNLQHSLNSFQLTLWMNMLMITCCLMFNRQSKHTFENGFKILNKPILSILHFITNVENVFQNKENDKNIRNDTIFIRWGYPITYWIKLNSDRFVGKGSAPKEHFNIPFNQFDFCFFICSLSFDPF